MKNIENKLNDYTSGAPFLFGKEMGKRKFVEIELTIRRRPTCPKSRGIIKDRSSNGLSELPLD